MDLRLTYSSKVIEAVTSEFDGTTTLIIKGVKEIQVGAMFDAIRDMNLSQMHEGMMVSAMEEALDAIMIQQALSRGLKSKERV